MLVCNKIHKTKKAKRKMKLKTKRAALELSVSTIVVIVIAVSMLVLGLVLVRTIFKSSIDNVEGISDKVEQKINELYSDEESLVLYPSTGIIKLKQGNTERGIAFGIKNLEAGTAVAKMFSYKVSLADTNVKQKCGVSDAEVEKWISLGTGGELKGRELGPGQDYKEIFRPNIPLTAPLCTVRFNIDVKVDNMPYAGNSFDIKVEAK